MSELSNLSASANRKFVAAQLHWSQYAGSDGQAAGFNHDVDGITASVKRQMDNVHASTGVDVSTAKSDLDALAAAVKQAGAVVPPAATIE